MEFLNKTIEAAVFDMDGTMFDTERLRIQMLKKASLDLFGTEMADDLLYDSLGVSAVTGERLAKEMYGDEFPYKEIRKLADDLERDHIREHGVPVKNGLYNLLERLKKNEVLLALATSSRREIVMEYLIRAKVLRYFDIIVCGDEVEKGKPHPEIFLKAITELNCAAENCLIIEDSLNGLKAAIAAGGLPIFIKDIKEMEDEIKAQTFRNYEKTTEFRDDLIPCTRQLPIPMVTDPFPQSFDHEIVGIHGFGAIGGGYFAEIFSHWDGYTRPKKIIGSTRNQIIAQLVNSLGKYCIKFESIAYFETIDHVEIIDQDDETQVIDMYEKSELIGLSLPEKAIVTQAGLIAKALLNRYEKQLPGLTIMIVLNRMNAAKYVKRHVEKALQEIVPEETAKAIIRSTHFIETVVNRMVSTSSEDMIASRLKNDFFTLAQTIREYQEDMEKVFEVSEVFENSVLAKKKTSRKKSKNAKLISISQSISTVSQIAKAASEMNVTLFSAEPDMAIYSSSGNPYSKRLCQTVEVENIKLIQEIKNKLSNGTHAIIAWYSAILGYQTIGQGMGDERVEKLALSIMKKEIRPVLVREYPEMKKYINAFIAEFIKRCRLSFKDGCDRVGRDPMRKLQRGERILGTIQLANDYGIETPGLEFGAACALVYALNSETGKDSESEKIKEIYRKHKSLEDILTYHGAYNKTPYKGLRSVEDQELIGRIIAGVEKLQTMKEKEE